MAEDAETPTKKKGGGKGLIIGLALALILGGGGFYAVYSGMVALPLPDANPAPKPDEVAKAEAEAAFAALPRTAFAPMEPLVVSLGSGAAIRQLQLVAQLEIEPSAEEAIAALQPRVRDVLTTYLRAVSPADVEDPAALLRMRAQMLRRVQVVTGEGMVRDLLVSEFILR